MGAVILALMPQMKTEKKTTAPQGGVKFLAYLNLFLSVPGVG